MSENIVSLISVIIGVSLITTVLVSEKFKGNINTVVSLIIAISVVSLFSYISFPNLNLLPTYSSDFDTYNYNERYLEEYINKKIESELCLKFDLEEVLVESELIFSEESAELKYINVHVKTNVLLSDILNFIEDEYGLRGYVCVFRIKDGES